MTDHLYRPIELYKEELEELYSKGTPDWEYHDKLQDTTGLMLVEGYSGCLEWRKDCGYCIIIYYCDGVDETWGRYVPLSEL